MNSALKIVFMGSPEFAVASLDILVKNGYSIVGVITSADKPAGRGLEMQQSAVKKYCLQKKIPVLQPEKLKNPEFIDQLNSLQADLQVVVAFRMLPEQIWKKPPMGTINLHASLLPQYRGAAPINWAIINGESESGVSTFFLQNEIDTGKIIYRANVAIGENETAGDLHDKLMIVGSELLLKTVQDIEKGSFKETDQSAFINSGEILKPAPKLFKPDGKINWNKPIHDIHNLIRGLSPYPTAYTELFSPSGKSFLLKIFKTIIEPGTPEYAVHSIVTDEKNMLKIEMQEGRLSILELQLAGKKRMNIKEFLRGFPINQNWRIG